MRADVLVDAEVDERHALRLPCGIAAAVACQASTSMSGGGETGST